MPEISGQGPITPREKQMYEQEYRHGVDLFQRALEQSSQAANPFQKEQFDEVMEKAMMVLNQTAKELKRKDLLDQNQKIANDLKNYQDQPSDSTREKLTRDLNGAKGSIG